MQRLRRRAEPFVATANNAIDPHLSQSHTRDRPPPPLPLPLHPPVLTLTSSKPLGGQCHPTPKSKCPQ